MHPESNIVKNMPMITMNIGEFSSPFLAWQCTPMVWSICRNSTRSHVVSVSFLHQACDSSKRIGKDFAQVSATDRVRMAWNWSAAESRMATLCHSSVCRLLYSNSFVCDPSGSYRFVVLLLLTHNDDDAFEPFGFCWKIFIQP